MTKKSGNKNSYIILLLCIYNCHEKTNSSSLILFITKFYSTFNRTNTTTTTYIHGKIPRSIRIERNIEYEILKFKIWKFKIWQIKSGVISFMNLKLVFSKI